MGTDYNLRSYLMSDFSNQRNKQISLIDLYTTDNHEYLNLIKRGVIDEEAQNFFQIEGRKILAASKIRLDALRILRYEQIIDDYIDEHQNSVNSPVMVSNKRDKKSMNEISEQGKLDKIKKSARSLEKQDNNSMSTTAERQTIQEREVQPLHCIHDASVLDKVGVSKVKISKTGKPLEFPKYYCPVCNQLYTSVKGYKDTFQFRLNNAIYINVNPQNDILRYNEYLRQHPEKNECFVYGNSKPIICRCCHSKSLATENVQIRTIQDDLINYNLRRCRTCDAIYVPYAQYIEHQDEWNVLNPEDLSRFEKEVVTKNKVSEKQATKNTSLIMDKPAEHFYIYGTSKPVTCRLCNSTKLVKRVLQYKTKKKKTSNYYAKYCSSCNTYYIPYGIARDHPDNWHILNPDELPKIEEDYRLKKEEKKRRAAEQKAEEYKRLEAKKAHELEEKRRKERFDKQLAHEKMLLSRIDKQLENIQQFQDSLNAVIHDHDNNIRVKDFVVRRTTFKCRHNYHKLQNIDGIIGVIDQDGNVRNVNVPAGYCPVCNTFFIMESTYQSLKSKGTPICRVSDEKAYLSDNTFINGMKLAQESVLKQYGYSVSQQEGLSSARRKKILALLVDNEVLTRSEIISYLDFFINQRKDLDKYGRAIDKWESDREFISEYKAGSYTRYGVGGIYRKH